MQRVEVALDRNAYVIHVGRGLLAQPPLLEPWVRGRSHAVVVSDDIVAPLYSTDLADALRLLVQRVDVLTFPSGEASKSVATAERLWNQLLDLATDRQTLLVALGGGVVGDLAGFVASSYARGLDWVQVPTTLLAQVDSSVGGKVGVNLPGAKNMVGFFSQPQTVLADVDLLASLPDREYRAGLAEVVKYGVIMDAEFFELLERRVPQLLQRDAATLLEVVAHCCRLKARVVVEDERETLGQRAILNYGHTFAHALEAETEYGRYLHGEAVAIGMHCAARLARLMRRVDDAFLERQRGLLVALGLPIDPPDTPAAQLLSAMRRDKKAVAGQMRFILPTRLGHVETVADVDEHFVRVALQKSE